MKKVLFCLLLAAALNMWGIVIPAGSVEGNWDVEDSPYFIDGNISIESSSSLFIEPGVEIIFNDQYSLNVYGQLVAEGTENDSILFSCVDTALGWYGIRFIDTNNNAMEQSLLSFCIVEKGAAIGTGDLSNGGGVFCSNSSNLVIDQCHFRLNYASWDGGAISLNAASDITVSNTLFTTNSCGFYGAAMICYSSSPHLYNCDFIANDATVFAAGFSAWTNSEPYLLNCRFIDNTAGACCGIYGVSSILELINCLFINNSTQYGAGGAMGLTSCTTTASNLTMVDNSSALTGGAFWVNGGHLDLYNSILWQNYPDQISLEGSGSATAGYSCLEGGYEGEEIIDLDPLFEDYSLYDLHLTEDSPCVDSGNSDLPGLELPEYDLDGLMRITDGDGNGSLEIDLGVYEYELAVIYEPPAHLTVDAATGTIGWQEPEMEELTGYNIYLDNQLIELITAPAAEYIFSELIAGVEYTAGVQAEYFTGESTIEEISFTYSPTNQTLQEIVALSNCCNYPNPFNPSTTISFSTTKAGMVVLNIYNLKGEYVNTLWKDDLPAATHQIIWDGLDKAGNTLPSGIYFYSINTVSSKYSGRMIMIK